MYFLLGYGQQIRNLVVFQLMKTLVKRRQTMCIFQHREISFGSYNQLSHIRVQKASLVFCIFDNTQLTMKQKRILTSLFVFFLYFDFDLCYNLNTSYTWHHVLSLTFTFQVPYKDCFIVGAAIINFLNENIFRFAHV